MSLPRKKPEELSPQELKIRLFRAFREKNISEISTLLNPPNNIMFLANNAQLNNDGNTNTLQHLAAQLGDLEIIRLLKERSNLSPYGMLRLNKNHETPLHIAASLGHTDIVNFFIEMEANLETPNNHNETPLWLAASEGHTKIVQDLIIARANIHARDSNNNAFTPLHRAAQNGHVATVKALISAGANIKDFQTKDNVTPLHLAAMGGHDRVIECLIKAGADIESSNIQKLTPLHLAVINNHPATVRCLLKRKAQIEAPDINGRTSLHLAVLNDLDDVIHELLKHGAKITTTDQSLATLLSRLKPGEKSKLRPDTLEALYAAETKELRIETATSHKSYIDQLQRAITQLATYGKNLPHGKKSAAVTALVTTLQEELNTYNASNDMTPQGNEAFIKNMQAHLDPKSELIKKISAYRLNVKTILKNILLVLSVFGPIVGKLRDVKPDSVLFFGPKGVQGKKEISDFQTALAGLHTPEHLKKKS